MLMRTDLCVARQSFLSALQHHLVKTGLVITIAINLYFSVKTESHWGTPAEFAVTHHRSFKKKASCRVLPTIPIQVPPHCSLHVDREVPTSGQSSGTQLDGIVVFQVSLRRSPTIRSLY